MNIDQNLKDLPAQRNYSLTVWHVLRVQDLSGRLAVPQGEVVRRGIDLMDACGEQVVALSERLGIPQGEVVRCALDLLEKQGPDNGR